VEVAVDKARDLEFKHAVLWLLQQAPTKAPAIFPKLMNRPLIPLSHAKELVAAGMRVSYAQLLAAAKSMVEGVEVWVQAQQQGQVESDIPEVAVTICCSKGRVSARYLCFSDSSCLLQCYVTCTTYKFCTSLHPSRVCDMLFICDRISTRVTPD
jgi:hypothetical protein